MKYYIQIEHIHEDYGNKIKSSTIKISKDKEHEDVILEMDEELSKALIDTIQGRGFNMQYVRPVNDYQGHVEKTVSFHVEEKEYKGSTIQIDLEKS